jgi:CYTH domain-containing protein
MIARTAGEGRYARMEREQRWVLGELPDDLDRPVSIVDLYIGRTRLRLRRMESGSEVVFKLGQKVRRDPETPETVKLTNMYLSEPEYVILSQQLEGDEISKTRWDWSTTGRPMAVDQFHGRLAGLITVEVELDGDERRLAHPPLVIADVTDDDRFSGGTLATTSAEAMRVLLDSLVSPSP